MQVRGDSEMVMSLACCLSLEVYTLGIYARYIPCRRTRQTPVGG